MFICLHVKESPWGADCVCVLCHHGMHPLHCRIIEHLTLSYREALSARYEPVISPEMEPRRKPQPSNGSIDPPNPHQAQTESVFYLLAYVYTNECTVVVMSVMNQNDREPTPPPHFPAVPPTWAAYSQQDALKEEAWLERRAWAGRCRRVVTERCLFAVVGGDRGRQPWGLTWYVVRDVVVLRQKTITIRASSCSQWRVSFINEAVVFLNNNYLDLSPASHPFTIVLV